MQGKKEQNRTTLYVGNLPHDLSEDDIRAIFADFGEVGSVKLVRDRMTGRPRGFGFIEMASRAAERARQELNHYRFGGRILRVDTALDRTPS